jgi:uncharacterized protein (TIGR03067 family)
MRLPRWFHSAAVTSSVAVAAALTSAARAADDLDRLQGTWRCVNRHIGRRDHKDVSVTWVIDGRSLTTEFLAAFGGTIALDKRKTPWRFTFTVDTAPGVQRTGTCRVEGKTLTRYYGQLSTYPPPDDLPARPARGYVLEVWERTSAAADGLEGEWELRSVTTGALPNFHTGEDVMVVEGARYRRRTRSCERATIAVDATQDPKHLDITFLDDPVLGRHTAPWVYRLDGDRLTAWESTSSRRPTEVSEAPDSPQSYWVFEKKKP